MNIRNFEALQWIGSPFEISDLKSEIAPLFQPVTFNPQPAPIIKRQVTSLVTYGNP